MKLNLKSKRGQNTAEYMLLLLLIGGGSILAFKTFGKGIINRFASVTSIITGGEKKVMTPGVIDDAVNANVNFQTFDGQGDGASATTPSAPATGNGG